MTKKKDGAQPRQTVKPAKLPAKRRGWLVCDQCTMTLEFNEGPGPWPQHRCGLDIRPFDHWTPDSPHPTPISPTF
jgi:hypothetical protein